MKGLFVTKWDAGDLRVTSATFLQVLVFVAVELAGEFAGDLRVTFCKLLKTLRVTLRLSAGDLVRVTPILKYGPGALAPSPFTLVFQRACFGSANARVVA
jgi:hypothetical protein